jgi:hypothetical protein
MIIRYLLHCLELHCHKLVLARPRYSQRCYSHRRTTRHQASTSVLLLTLSHTFHTQSKAPSTPRHSISVSSNQPAAQHHLAPPAVGNLAQDQHYDFTIYIQQLISHRNRKSLLKSRTVATLLSRLHAGRIPRSQIMDSNSCGFPSRTVPQTRRLWLHGNFCLASKQRNSYTKEPN